MRTLLPALLLISCCGLPSCTVGALDDAGSPDSGATTEIDAKTETGANPDPSPPRELDAGATADSGAPSDTSAPSDTAMSIDTSTPADTGSVTDTGGSDAGSSSWSCEKCVREGASTLTTSSASKPAYLAPTVFAPFSTKVTRIAGDAGSVTAGVTWQTYARHHYSKDGPWNADATIFKMNNGSTAQYLDGSTYAPISTCAPNGDNRWHPTLPNILIVVKNYRVFWFDVKTCKETRSWTLPFAATGFGNNEGNPSFDGRYMLATDATRAVVVDMDPSSAGRVGAVRNMASDCTLAAESGCAALTRPCCEIDNGTISASGKYALVQYNGGPFRIFDVGPDLALTPRALTKDYRSMCPAPYTKGTPASGYTYRIGHADVTLDPFDGNEDIVVGVEGCWNSDGKIVEGNVVGDLVKIRVRDGQMTPISPPSSAGMSHVSTRNYQRPGWVYVSYHYLSGAKFSSELAAYKLDGSKAVERWTVTRTNSPPYEAEPHLVPSPDGKRIAFVSNWMRYCTSGCGTTDNVQSYVVDAR